MRKKGTEIGKIVRARMKTRKYSRQFGFPMKPYLTKGQRQKCLEINNLFDDARQRHGREVASERAIFHRVFPNQEQARIKLQAFIHDVRTCPEEVLTFVRGLLHAEVA